MTPPLRSATLHAMRRQIQRARNGAWMALAVLGSCSAPLEPLAATSMPITAEYRRWWKAMEQCSGLRGSIDRQTFWKVEAMDRQAVARWYPGRIVLTSLFVNDSLVVSHEMVHALIGRPGHPAEYFRRRCGDLMGDGR
jgi:hypothetical protein